jgi:hypothetical protein
MLFQTLKMQFNCFLNELDNLFPGISYDSTTRKIWRISTEACGTLLNDNCVFHNLIILQSGLFEDIFKGTDWNFNAGLACNSYSSRLSWVTKLPMAALGTNLLPTILPQQLKNISYFHNQSMSQAD